MKAYRLVTPKLIQPTFIGRVRVKPSALQQATGPITRVLVVEDGILKEAEVQGMSIAVKLVTLTDNKGDPRAVNPAKVMQVEHVDATSCRVHMAGTANFVAQGPVADVVQAILDGS